jgi:ribokinase
VGGNAANTAVAFARLGFNTAIHTRIGDDDTGEMIERSLKRNSIDTQYLVQEKGKGSNYSTVISTHGERTILVYHEKRDYTWPELQPARWVYLTSMKDGSEKMYPQLLDYVRRYHVNLVFQPGTYQLRRGPEAAAEILHHTSLIVVNREEAELYTQMPDASYGELLRALHKLGPSAVVITDGTKGSFAYDGHQYHFMNVIDDFQPKETTGAGDAFAAGITAALMESHTLPESLRWGQMEASSVIQQVGAQAGLLYKKQLEHLLEKYIHQVSIPYQE